MSNQIEIKIEAKKLTPEKFLEAVESFFGLIQGVAKNIAQKPVNWTVEVDKGSAVVRARVENPSVESEQSIVAVCSGMRSLRSGVKIIPHGFTQNEVRASKKLVSVIDGTDVQSVSMKNGSLSEDLPVIIIVIADAILFGQSHIAFGSIEGKIVNLSVRHAFCCTIYEPLYRRDITCNIQKPEAQKEVFKAMEKKSKVIAGGLIHYAKEGYPMNIAADTIEIFPDESTLPSLKEIQAIYQLYK
jgi:hypothetical protein